MYAALQRPLRDVAFQAIDVTVTRRDDASIIVAPTRPLGPYPDSLCERLEHWAAVAPNRVFIAERGPDGAWRRVTYAQALQAARRFGAALLARGLSAERPLVILSGNEIGHALLALGAMLVGIPYCPVSPAYSLISSDHGKLRHIFALLTPGLVYVADGEAFASALDAVWPTDAEVIVGARPARGRRSTLLEDFGAAGADSDVDGARAAVSPDTIVKFLLTSGSTGNPKAVINTQRMVTSNQVMLRETLAFLKDGPTIVDWLPWNHTFGGNHNVGLVLYNGGSFYIDCGKPTPGGIEETVRNLREIAPTVYFNVPKGYESLVPHLRADRRLRETFFSRVQSLFFAGAGMAPHVWQALDDLAMQTIGCRIPILTGLGATETAPFSLCCSPTNTASGRVGAPVPGNVLKLTPVDGKLEARVKGPNVTPGYWRQPDLTAAAFDEEGYYRYGDALKFVDENDHGLGLAFDGRISEDFKLATGTWVSVGPLRARAIAECAPLVRDVVLAGLNRDDLTALVFVDQEACLALAPDLGPGAQLPDIVRHPAVVEAMIQRLERLAALPGGSSTRIVRAVLLDSPPDIDAGEVTDKGSINQRAVLAKRDSLVADLYRDPPPAHVLTLRSLEAR